MTVPVYRLVGKAKSAAIDFIPSLIGHTLGATSSDDDTYFEMIELPIEALAISSLQTTRWVNYDSLPLDRPDPIVAVRAGEHAYYITLSELDALIEEHGSAGTKRLLAPVKASLRV